jgi:predicted O-linked N-acetylglucosamine transferase (SPINDLY family)
MTSVKSTLPANDPQNMQPLELRQHGDQLFNRGQVADAIVFYQQALALKPDYAEVYNNMGMALKRQNRLEAAIECYQKAFKFKPDYAIACNNLANALKESGNLSAAKINYEKALALEPDVPEVYNNLGNVLMELGHIEDAVAKYHSALRLKPDYVEAHSNLGNALQKKKAYGDAIRCYQSALRYDSNYYKAYNNLGNAYQQNGELSRAVDCYQMALKLKPDYADAHNNSGNVRVEMGKIPEALESYRKALEFNPSFAVAHSNLLLTLNYQSVGDLSSKYHSASAWWRHHGLPVYNSVNHKNSDDSIRRLKIGYVSPDFRRHSVSFFFLPLIQHHNRQLVEVYCYSDVKSSDDVTGKISHLTDQWRPVSGLSDEVVAEQVRKDGIDILVDLAGHTAENRLLVFARKPAPVQITWLGYPNTTGMPVMDYRLTDDIADPPGQADQFHSETLIRLPDGFLCYSPPDDAPDVSGLPARQTGRITFGSFNNLPKINAAVIALWSRLLRQVPQSDLLLKSKQFADEPTRQRFLDLFASHGIAAERISLLPRVPSTAGHLALYHQVDIGLDPFPYNGTTTTCEALWMGVPVVSLRGDRHAGRVGASILARVGLEELTADSEEQYLEIGRKLAENLDGLEEYRAVVRPRMGASALCDGNAFAQTMEHTFRKLWDNWCQKNDPGAPITENANPTNPNF